jgi:hypothetical protein
MLNKICSLLFVLMLSGCAQVYLAQSDVTAYPVAVQSPIVALNETVSLQEDLDSWLGECEYLYIAATKEALQCLEENPDIAQMPGYTAPKVIMHELIIYKDNGEYFAICTGNGWMTGYEIQATVRGNSKEIEIVFQDLTWGFWYEAPEIGEVIFKLKKWGRISL